METNTHKALDFIEHLWPLLSGIVITLLAIIKLWWHSHRETKSRIKNLEVLAENSVTHKELQACRDNVREEDERNLTAVLKEMKDQSKENASQHENIVNQIIQLHKK